MDNSQKHVAVLVVLLFQIGFRLIEQRLVSRLVADSQDARRLKNCQQMIVFVQDLERFQRGTHSQFRVTNSCRLNSARETDIHAASSE